MKQTMTDNFNVFVVDDDNFYSDKLQYHLTLNPDVTVTKYSNAREFLKHMDMNPDAVMLDSSLPDMSGINVLKKIREYNSSIPVVMISDKHDIQAAIALLKEGAYDYVLKDDETQGRVWNIIKNIRDNKGVKKEIPELKRQLKREFYFSANIIGRSSSMNKVFAMIERAVKSNITVSITGETGTGKEVVAKSIHHNSLRAKKPFVAVNITAIPSELVESELFGHEKGSFTGANVRRIGKFEEAGEGTVFLDEIGEMSINMQSKLLRVLQERELTRVGGNGTVKIKCRVLSATHKDMAEEVRNGNFREDLYYRLLGLPINLPPLRERGSDTLLLARYFINEYAEENNVMRHKLTKSAEDMLMNYSWPGNIRELKAVIELGCVMTDSREIGLEHITFNRAGSTDSLLQNEMSLEEYKNRIVKFFLDKYNNDVIDVAERLNIGKSTIYRMLQEKVV